MKKSGQNTVPESALILADIEGITGVFDKQQCKPGTSAWRAARSLITADVNAAIHGLKAAGVGRIFVRDMHGTGFNILSEKIEDGVQCLQGHHWKPVPLLGTIPDAACAIMIGWHAGPDQQTGFSPHIFHKCIRSLKIDNVPVTEVELFAAVLGEYHIPVTFLTADKIAIERIRGNMPWISTLAIPKQALSKEKAQAIRGQIESCVRESVTDMRRTSPLILGPHMAEMRTRRQLFTWESASGLETFTRVLANSVFSPYPTCLLPLLLAGYRLWSRIGNER